MHNTISFSVDWPTRAARNFSGQQSAGKFCSTKGTFILKESFQLFSSLRSTTCEINIELWPCYFWMVLFISLFVLISFSVDPAAIQRRSF